MKRVNYLLGIFLAFLTVFAVSCQNKPQKSAPIETDTTEVAIDSEAVVRDTTLYGECGECGMSTFCLITDKKDTIYVARSSEDGYEGKIYGSIIIGDRFCMTIRHDEQTLVKAINLTELDKFIKGRYKILNCHVLLMGNTEKADTLDITALDSDEGNLELEGPHGKLKFKPVK